MEIDIKTAAGALSCVNKLFPGDLLEIHRVPLDRVGQEPHCQHSASDNGDHKDPQRRLFIVKHSPNALLYPCFSKGQGAGGDPSARNTAFQKRSGIGLFFFGREPLDHPLVTGQLHIPAQQDIRKPQ